MCGGEPCERYRVPDTNLVDQILRDEVQDYDAVSLTPEEEALLYKRGQDYAAKNTCTVSYSTVLWVPKKTFQVQIILECSFETSAKFQKLSTSFLVPMYLLGKQTEQVYSVQQ